MKLKLYILDYEIDDLGEEIEVDRYIDMWIDENAILGFYVPVNQDEIKCLNLFFNAMQITVVQNKELVGIITLRDILNFHPEVYPELREYEQIAEESSKLNRFKKRKIIDGICEECGNREMLVEFNGMLICESCRDST